MCNLPQAYIRPFHFIIFRKSLINDNKLDHISKVIYNRTKGLVSKIKVNGENYHIIIKIICTTVSWRKIGQGVEAGNHSIKEHSFLPLNTYLPSMTSLRYK